MLLKFILLLLTDVFFIFLLLMFIKLESLRGLTHLHGTDFMLIQAHN